MRPGGEQQQAMKASTTRRTGEIYLLCDLPRMRPYIVRLLRTLEHEEIRRSCAERELAALRSARTPTDRRRRILADMELRFAEAALERLSDECAEIGVQCGQNGACELLFPTMVDDRSAYFVWKRGDLLPVLWRFSEAEDDRFIPERWYGLFTPEEAQARQ
jgi:hypothetical protein